MEEFVRSHYGNSHLAEEVAQDAVMRSLLSPPRDSTALLAWLRSTANHLVLGRLRKRARARARERLMASSVDRLPVLSHVERSELIQRVRDEILRLREPYRSILRMRYYEGLSLSEIAARSGIPAGTVRARMTRTHSRLRRLLKPEYGDGNDQS